MTVKPPTRIPIHSIQLKKTTKFPNAPIPMALSQLMNKARENCAADTVPIGNAYYSFCLSYRWKGTPFHYWGQHPNRCSLRSAVLAQHFSMAFCVPISLESATNVDCSWTRLGVRKLGPTSNSISLEKILAFPFSRITWKLGDRVPCRTPFCASQTHLGVVAFTFA